MSKTGRLLSAALEMKGQIGATDYETSEKDIAVVTTDRGQQEWAAKLLDTTIQLVESGTSGGDALEALRELNLSPKDADIALGLLRLEYFPFELRDANTAWRYLVAVKHGDYVSPPTAEESARIDRIELLAHLEPEQAFEELEVLEPNLRDVKTQVVGECNRWDGSDFEHDGFLQIDGMLIPLLGPESNQTDPVLRSRYAIHIVRHHLIEVANLLA